MIQYQVYPGGRRRVVTFSYDDGDARDRRLAELFRRYGVKATFHLISGHYREMGAGERREIAKLYEGHEISCHTLGHGWGTMMPPMSLVREIAEDRKILEDIAGYPMVGMSYPFGAYSADVENVLRACGLRYCRTTLNTSKFDLPEDFLAWHPTCHHKNAQESCQRFLDLLDVEWSSPLLYIWGHSFELKTETDWEMMEALVRSLAGNPKIWYATNAEIYDYVSAQRALRISCDETVFYNPSAIPVWVEKDKARIIEIPAGETVCLK